VKRLECGKYVQKWTGDGERRTSLREPSRCVQVKKAERGKKKRKTISIWRMAGGKKIARATTHKESREKKRLAAKKPKGGRRGNISAKDTDDG